MNMWNTTTSGPDVDDYRICDIPFFPTDGSPKTRALHMTKKEERDGTSFFLKNTTPREESHQTPRNVVTIGYVQNGDFERFKAVVMSTPVPTIPNPTTIPDFTDLSSEFVAWKDAVVANARAIGCLRRVS